MRANLIPTNTKRRFGWRWVVLGSLILLVLGGTGCGRRGPLKPLKPKPPPSSLAYHDTAVGKQAGTALARSMDGRSKG